MLYPLNIDLAGRLVIVVGGGTVAERKVSGLLAAEADISVRVIAPNVTPNLRMMASTKKITWIKENYAQNMLKGAFLVYAATNEYSVNMAVADEAKVCGALVNVIDDPSASSFQVPSSIRRNELLITVSTGGRSPALSRAMRMELEQIYPQSFGLWLECIKKLRTELKKKDLSSEHRTLFWRVAMRSDILSMVRDGELEKAEVELRNAALNIRAQSSDCSG